MTYEIRFKPSAAEAVRRLPKHDQRRIIAKIEALAGDPRPPGCRKLTGEEDFYRVRVGDYRIIYRLEDKRLVVLIVKVGHREEIYRRGS